MHKVFKNKAQRCSTPLTRQLNAIFTFRACKIICAQLLNCVQIWMGGNWQISLYICFLFLKSREGQRLLQSQLENLPLVHWPAVYSSKSCSMVAAPIASAILIDGICFCAVVGCDILQEVSCTIENISVVTYRNQHSYFL